MTALHSKLPDVGDTIFNEMSQLALRCKAINLGQGFPDYRPEDALIEAVHQAMLDGHNQYAPMAGIPLLREAISGKVLAQHGRHYDPDSEVTVTSGATEALMSSFLALAGPGDEVLLIDPSYDLYAPAVQLSGAVAIRIPMQPPDNHARQFRIDWQRIQDSITPKTRLLVLNFPHNPTGITLGDADLDVLEQICAHTPLIILSDEAYEHIVFDGERQHSVITRPSLAARSVHISSFGKTFHATGWKMGYCCAPQAIMNEVQKVHQFTVYSVSTPMQHGIATYLRGPNTIAGLSAFYQKKRDRLARGLQSTPLKPLHSSGTFFLLVDTSALDSHNEKELALRLTHEVGVTTIPVSVFYPDPNAPTANHQLLRLCFAKQDATLDRAVDRLQSLNR